MREAGDGVRFAIEAGPESRIRSQRSWKDLDRDRAPEPRVGRQVDLPHSAGTEQALDLVWPQLTAGFQIRLMVQHRAGRFQDWSIDQEVRLLMFEQRFDLASQLLIARAGRGQHRATLARFPLENQLIKLGDALPALAIHVRPLRLGKSTRRLADNPARVSV
jgi:hypothetical protein